MTGTSGPGDLYELLGVRPDASAGEIIRAYHRRARDLHPDTQPGQAGESAAFRELEEAYRVLRDPARRAAYDQLLRQARAAEAPRPATDPGPPAVAWPSPAPRSADGPGPAAARLSPEGWPAADPAWLSPEGWPAADPAWLSPEGWPAGRPPGAALWAGPVQVTPPGASAAAPGGPAPGTAGFWLAALACWPGWPW